MGTNPQDFINAYAGRYVNLLDDPRQGHECVALFWKWNKLYNGGEAYDAVGAQDLWKGRSFWKGYDRVDPYKELRFGDWVLWDGLSGAYPNGGYGHVAMFVRDNGNGTGVFFSQNPGVAQQMTLSYNGVIGYLRPRSNGKEYPNMTLRIDQSASSPNFTLPADVPLVFGGYNRELRGHTIHHWDAKANRPTWEAAFNTLMNDWRNPGSRQVSAHYMAAANRAACLVSPENAAWHTGTYRGNAWTIGIECDADESDGTYQTVAEILAFDWFTYNMPHTLYRHSDWTSTECPGGYDLARLGRMAEAELVKLRGGTVKPEGGTVTPIKPAPAKPAPAPKRILHPEDEPYWLVERGDGFPQIAKHYFGTSSEAAIKRITDYNGLSRWGLLAGTKVWIPGPLVWTVESYGDTLRSIAKYYGVDAAWLAQKNGLAGPDSLIYLGSNIIIKD